MKRGICGKKSKMMIFVQVIVLNMIYNSAVMSFQVQKTDAFAQ